DQQYDCTQNCDDNAGDIQTSHCTEADCRGNESAHKRADNTDQNGHDKAARALSRQDDFGNYACNQSQYDPGYDPHKLLLSTVIQPPFAGAFSLHSMIVIIASQNNRQIRIQPESESVSGLCLKTETAALAGYPFHETKRDH